MAGQRGFNLIEVLATLAIASFLMGIAVPSYQRILEQQSQMLALARLQAVLSHARLMANVNATSATAIKVEDRGLILCYSTNGQDCSTETATNDNILVLTKKDRQLVHFSSGAGFILIWPAPELLIRPLPNRGSTGTFLPCTGFKHVKPKGITLSSAGSLRVNDGTGRATNLKLITELANQCL
ncbi:MAG TPA: prepilin-type N-terminal cleavage/methylation domain-containing protein [Marinospirillum sp.]|uniref:pilus assembly FimT family protein n=1 Tax=Marinospirillum sp. TaxID=2183934 RepID=UPI002B477E6E|nr:prepilin-type N-terminal cleavage/methylation domain-containing protein [Marinospirillum sp.]HKM16301.1 prepilin-type N-terminal cleavage/methylation domain-containing protein [Marinospirillum sp.]